MLSAQLVVYIPTIISCLFLGLLVIANNPRDTINRRFFIFIASLIAWISCLFIADTSSSQNIALIFLRLGMVFISMVPYLLLYFSSVFPDRKQAISKRKLKLLTIFPIFFIATSFNDAMIGKVEATAAGAQVKESGILYTIFSIYLASFILASFIHLIRKKKKLDPRLASQVSFVIIGSAITAIINVITNIVLVNSESGSQFGIYFGIASLILFVAAVSYSIVKHRLFDVRLVVARSLAYLLSVGSLALLYGLLAFTVAETIFTKVDTDRSWQQFVYTALAVVLAFTFQPIKIFFDRWSNRIFYRDAYDSQELFDELNKVLVSTIDLSKLLSSSAKIINNALKTEFCIFVINEIGKSPQRVLGTHERSFSEIDIETVRSITPKLRVKSIIMDELEESNRDLQAILRRNDIAALIRLTDTPTKSIEGTGYIILGGKKSGSPYSHQDIRVLEIIADELVIAIQNSLRFEEIKNFNLTLQDKVDDATRKLRQANQRLIELDQTKDDFISMASHQLRTPLTSIKGYVSMVMEGDAGKITKKQTELLDQAFISSQRMVYLIADLLNVSRLRTGKFVIEPKPTNLADVIEGEIAQLKETAKGRELELTFNKPQGFPTLMLDETKIRQVIMNFADNAIYYTPKGGHITVNLIDNDDAIELTVSDDGIGVPKAEQHHLFNKFYRAGNAKKARPDGTGLGLFMAKKVVAAQGGSIIFTSQEGKGSTFGFRFSKTPLLPENFKGMSSHT